MCGIAGLVGTVGITVAESAVQAMLDSQAHRGPDDEGVIAIPVHGGSAALGNRRLAIQDLSPLGHQPMLNPDTGDALVYNGEIYNAPELRRELEQAGYRFRGHSDTEVLLRAYEFWGRECLDKLRGMFAFCLWDAAGARLFVARDHLGIKPLYYAASPGRWFVCASEVRALLASGMVTASPGEQGMVTFLAYGAVQEPLTIWDGVLAVPRGSWIEVDEWGKTIAQGRFWHLPPPSDVGKVRLEHAIEEGPSILENATRRHLLSDVPVGIFLSSGLDSTIISALARKQVEYADQLQAFTISFPENTDYDEAAIARATATRLGIRYHEYPVGEQRAIQWIREGLECMDQPSIDGLNTYMVVRAAREQGITVALSGTGGDELFGGYKLFRRVQQLVQLLGSVANVPKPLRSLAARLVALPMNSVVRGKLRDLSGMSADVKGIYFQARRLMSNGDLASLGLDTAALGLENHFQFGADCEDCIVDGDPVATIARLESVFYMGNMLLRDADVFGMAKSLEIRVPLLDRDVVEWAFQFPGEVLLPSGASPKHLLRKMFGDFFTPLQLQQSKRGFALPFSSWLMGPLRDVMQNGLESLNDIGLLDRKGVKRVREVFLSDSQSPAWSRVWALITLGHWFSRQDLKIAANYAN